MSLAEQCMALVDNMLLEIGLPVPMWEDDPDDYEHLIAP